MNSERSRFAASIFFLSTLVICSFGCAAEEDAPGGTRPGITLLVSFDGLGVGFEGPQGSATLRNPSDNSLAVGPDHVVQTVNSRTAIFDKNGTVLYGPVETRNFFRGFGGPCEDMNNGDAVVRYDQLAQRWLVVMPIFRRVERDQEFVVPEPDGLARLSPIGRPGQPGPAMPLYQPPAPTDQELAAIQERRRARRAAAPPSRGSFAMCYAISTTSDPLGSYFRYEFVRPLFPDYPRPAIWPDGYYVPTSTGDDVIEKHACVVDRRRMLRGESATEQCVIIADVNFLNNADLDGLQVPPDGAPNIMMATGGSQLNNILSDDGIYVWKFSVNWENPSETSVEGPEKITVEPYSYLCGGQLKECIPQLESEQRIDSQGDKIMARLVYRRIGRTQSIVAVHSVATESGGGVRWYEFRIDSEGDVSLFQQGTYAPDAMYRWMASPAMDRNGNIGIGYSYGGPTTYPGQRFSGRMADDPPGTLPLEEYVLAEGEAAQATTLRWQDYTQTAVDPVDDCTIWYVGDYLKQGARGYSTKIGAFQLPGCGD